MPVSKSVMEQVQAIKAEERQANDFGYVNVFQGGTRVQTARTKEEFAQLKAELIDKLEQNPSLNAYARYNFADGSVTTLGKISFHKLVAPDYGTRLNINL